MQFGAVETKELQGLIALSSAYRVQVSRDELRALFFFAGNVAIQSGAIYSFVEALCKQLLPILRRLCSTAPFCSCLLVRKLNAHSHCARALVELCRSPALYTSLHKHIIQTRAQLQAFQWTARMYISR